MNAVNVVRVSLGLFAIASSSVAFSQLEEIVVTGSRVETTPGVFLRRHADYLLLEVAVTNDTREEAGREDEIYRTLRGALTAAERSREVEVSVVNDDGLVYPLTPENYRIDLSPGNRPDTSTATISMKTAVPATDADGQALVNTLREFVAGLSVVGRTQLDPVGDVQISVVDPHQYRSEIIKLVAGDISQVTSTLGAEYRVIVEGIDRPVEWFRLGLLDLGLFIPYRYTVIPQSVTSVATDEC
jgi:hypothetical protein